MTRRAHTPADWPYHAGEVTEPGSTSRRYSRTGRLFTDRDPTPAQIRMMTEALRDGVIPLDCDRRPLKGLVARRFVEILANKCGRLLPRGEVWIRRHLKAEEARKKAARRAKSRNYYRGEPSEKDRERIEQTRREARERVLAQHRASC